MAQILPWIAFNAFVLAMLALDLGVFHRKSHEVRPREALVWSGVWIALSFAFYGSLIWWKGSTPALEFLTGYLIEKSLSVDNLFVFLVIFSTFRVPSEYQHKVLFWGILGALVMRAGMIAAGAVLIARFHAVVYIFGAVLVLTALRMLLQRHAGPHPERNPLLRLAGRILPVADDPEPGRFFGRKNGRRAATPLFFVLLAIEFSDVVFAVDSIPAIFGVTEDPFVVYTSNVFAILGLRSLYFALAGVMGRFHLLKAGLSTVLLFVGAKMLLADVVLIPIGVSLAIVAGLIGLSVAASLAFPRRGSSTSPARPG